MTTNIISLYIHLCVKWQYCSQHLTHITTYAMQGRGGLDPTPADIGWEDGNMPGRQFITDIWSKHSNTSHLHRNAENMQSPRRKVLTQPGIKLTASLYYPSIHPSLHPSIWKSHVGFLLQYRGEFFASFTAKNCQLVWHWQVYNSSISIILYINDYFRFSVMQSQPCLSLEQDCGARTVR